jgi:hypothetical protein
MEMNINPSLSESTLVDPEASTTTASCSLNSIPPFDNLDLFSITERSELRRIDQLTTMESHDELQSMLRGHNYSWHTVNQALQQKQDHKFLYLELDNPGNILWEWQNLCRLRFDVEKYAGKALTRTDGVFFKRCLKYLKLIPSRANFTNVLEPDVVDTNCDRYTGPFLELGLDTGYETDVAETALQSIQDPVQDFQPEFVINDSEDDYLEGLDSDSDAGSEYEPPSLDCCQCGKSTEQISGIYFCWSCGHQECRLCWEEDYEELLSLVLRTPSVQCDNAVFTNQDSTNRTSC